MHWDYNYLIHLLVCIFFYSKLNKLCDRLVHLLEDFAAIQCLVTIKASVFPVIWNSSNEIETWGNSSMDDSSVMQLNCKAVVWMLFRWQFPFHCELITLWYNKQLKESRWLLLKRLKLLSLGSFSVLSQVVLVQESTLIFAFDLGFV